MGESMTENVIQLKRIKKAYTGSSDSATEVLKGIDMEVGRGEFVAIRGRSGSGKSSLMHIIGLLDRHYSGTYLLDGIDVGKLSGNRAAELRNEKIGFVFQQFNLLPRSTVIQNVLLPTTYHAGADDEKRALQIIEQVGLIKHINHRGNQLSGGQIQRVAIARALIMNPSYLLADEPTGNLDTKTSHEIMELFQKIHKKGATIVLVTHEDDIAQFAQRTIKLQDGEIVKGKSI
jgi:putative ABC transport system ATP-binding protein